MSLTQAPMSLLGTCLSIVRKESMHPSFYTLYFLVTATDGRMTVLFFPRKEEIK